MWNYQIGLRGNTERPSTVEQGTNVLLGQDPAAKQAMHFERNGSRVPEWWDGKAAVRIVSVLAQTP